MKRGPLCGNPGCDEPASRQSNGTPNLTCGKPECYQELAAARALDRSTGWPTLTGEIDFGGAFGRNNVRTESFGRVPMRPVTARAE